MLNPKQTTASPLCAAPTKVTMAELNARHLAAAAEARVQALTPEGLAREAALETRFKAEEASRLAWEADLHVPSPFEAGREAGELHLSREAPEELDDVTADLWLAGYDSLGSADDE